MKFLALAGLLFAPAALAAAVPYQCETVGKAGYLYTVGPHGSLVYLNVSRVAAGDNAFYLQNDQKWDWESHQHFNVVRCHLRNSNADLPESYVLIHLSKDTSNCLALGGPGDDKDHVKPAKESFTEANTLVVKPCEHASSSTFRQQIFQNRLGYETLPFELETVESNKEAARSYVGFRDNKIFLMTENPEEDDMSDRTVRLGIDVWENQ